MSGPKEPVWGRYSGMTIVVADIGATSLRVGEFSEATGEIKNILLEPSRDCADELIEQLVGAIMATKSTPEMIGVGYNGVVDSGRVWNFVRGEIDLKGALEEIFEDARVVVLNDAHAGAYDATRRGENPSTLVVTLGTAMGRAIIINNKVVTTSGAGEVYHRGQCSCGSWGCLSSAPAGRALGRHVSMLTSERNIKLGRGPVKISPQGALEGRRAGDEMALRGWGEWARAVTELVVSGALMIGATRIVVCGGFAQWVYDDIRPIVVAEAQKQFVEYNALKMPSIELAPNTSEAGLRGAGVALVYSQTS